MKKKFVIICGILLLFLVSCNRAHVTEENPWGFAHPNDLRMWLNNANITSQMAADVGAVTGNPALVGGGILGMGILGIIGAALFPKKKKEGEDNGN